MTINGMDNYQICTNINRIKNISVLFKLSWER